MFVHVCRVKKSQTNSKCRNLPELRRVRESHLSRFTLPLRTSPYSFTSALISLIRHADLTTVFSNILTLRKKNLSFSMLLNSHFCRESSAWHLVTPHLRPNL